MAKSYNGGSSVINTGNYYTQKPRITPLVHAPMSQKKLAKKAASARKRQAKAASKV